MKTIAEFRDFEIEERDNNTICIIQSDHNGGEDRIFLDKKQIPLLVSALTISESSLFTGYIAKVQFKDLVPPLNIYCDTADELSKLHNDIEQNGFGMECEILDSNRIVLRYED